MFSCSPPFNRENKMSKTLLVAQFFISMMMAAIMSGIMTAIAMGPTELWLHSWPRSFITAWPIAFVLSMPVGALSFWISGKLVRQETRANNATA